MAWNFYFKPIFLFILLLGLQPCVFAQDLNPELERHIKELKTAENDTNKLNLLGTIIMEAPDGVWENYNEPLKILSNSLMKSNDKAVSRNATKAHASALNNEAFMMDRDGDLEKALPIYKQSLNLSREIKDQFGVALTLNNIADLYQSMGNIELAIEYFKQSLEIRELIKDQVGIAQSLLNLGYLNDKLGDFTKAERYIKRRKGYKIESKH
jgi:tetratricopeptide (TPR) repeat protein